MLHYIAALRSVDRGNENVFTFYGGSDHTGHLIIFRVGVNRTEFEQTIVFNIE